MEPCGDLLPPCTCPSRESPLLQPPQGRTQALLSLHRGTQGSPRAPLAVAIRKITTTLYNVLLQFNTFQKADWMYNVRKSLGQGKIGLILGALLRDEALGS